MRSVGLDFGTSTILIAVREGDLPPRVVPIGSKTSWIPSIAGVDSRGSIVVGEAAEKLPRDRQIRDLKTEIGKGHQLDPSFGVRLEEVLEALLAHAVELGRKRDSSLFGKGDQVFVGCPSMWTLEPRKLLSNALKKVGIPVGVADLVEEPVAAGIGWVAEREFEKDPLDLGELLVVDAGGGTLDVAVLGFGLPTEGSEKASRLRVERMFVLASDSLQGSGGDLDRKLAEQISRDLGKTDATSLEFLDAARTLKESLSTRESSTVRLPSGKEVKVDRPGFEKSVSQSIKDFVETGVRTTRAALLRFDRSADPAEIRQCAPSDLSSLVGLLRWDTKQKNGKVGKPISDPEPFPAMVLMVGGTSLVPKFQSDIQEIFSHSAVVLSKEPQLAVVVGLTYSDRVSGLNMPRPPWNIVVEGVLDAKVVRSEVLHKAFEPLFTWEEMLKGHTHTGVQFNSKEGQFRFAIQDPVDSQKRYEIDDRTWAGDVNFKFYSTGDMVISDSKKVVVKRLRGWPQHGRSLLTDVLENRRWTDHPYPHH